MQASSAVHYKKVAVAVRLRQQLVGIENFGFELQRTVFQPPQNAVEKFVTQMEIEAPLVAKKALAGQFIILRVDEEGERIPLTVAGTNPEEGTVKIIFQIVGATTEKLNFAFFL